MSILCLTLPCSSLILFYSRVSVLLWQVFTDAGQMQKSPRWHVLLHIFSVKHNAVKNFNNFSQAQQNVTDVTRMSDLKPGI